MTSKQHIFPQKHPNNLRLVTYNINRRRALHELIQIAQDTQADYITFQEPSPLMAAAATPDEQLYHHTSFLTQLNDISHSAGYQANATEHTITLINTRSLAPCLTEIRKPIHNGRIQTLIFQTSATSHHVLISAYNYQ